VKIFLVSLVLGFGASFAMAANQYCQAGEATLQVIEQLRVLEKPYQVLYIHTRMVLRNDSCVRSKLVDQEIEALADLLLSDDYAQDTAEQIIGEFIAL